MAREVLSNGVINPDKYQADWYADLSNNWNLLNDLIGSAISGSEVDSKIATAIQELMIRTFQIVAELPVTGTEGVMYLVLIPDTSKYTAYVWENNAYRELGVIQMTITIDDELSTTSENPAQNKVITNALNNKAPISHTHSASDITSGLATVATSGSYNDLSNKPTIPTVNNATLTIQQNGTNVQTFTANQSTNATANITVPTKTSDLTNDSGFITSDNTKIPLAGSNAISGSLIPATDNAYDLGGTTYGFANIFTWYVQGSNTQKELSLFSSNNTYDPWNHGACISLYTNDYSGDSARIGTFSIRAQGSGNNTCNLIGTPSGALTWGTKNVAMQEDVIPRSGGAVLSGQDFKRTVDDSSLNVYGGNGYGHGAFLQLTGRDDAGGGTFNIQAHNGSTNAILRGKADGTLTWNGQSIQTTSDQRLKQQIAEIDDNLLDAWEDVNLVQFKYNDAVDQKKDKARLHTGFVVQQIDSACKEHGVDISQYGLYCHEVYQEETREVEHEDGTKTVEVVRPASEHYSLRYTEALIVECAYLRKCIKELRNEIEELKSSK